MKLKKFFNRIYILMETLICKNRSKSKKKKLKLYSN